MKNVSKVSLFSAVFCLFANVSFASTLLLGSTYEEIFTVDVTTGDVDVIAAFDSSYWDKKGWDGGGKITGVAQLPNGKLYVNGHATKSGHVADDLNYTVVNFLARVNGGGNLVMLEDYRPEDDDPVSNILDRGIGLEAVSNELLYTTTNEGGTIYEIRLGKNGRFQDSARTGRVSYTGDGGEHGNVERDPKTGDWYAITRTADYSNPGPNMAERPYLIKNQGVSPSFSLGEYDIVSNVSSWSLRGESNITFAQDGTLWGVNRECYEEQGTCHNLYGIDLNTGEAWITWDLSSQLQGSFITDLHSYSIDPVPEPTTMLLFGVGLAGLAATGRKRRN